MNDEIPGQPSPAPDPLAAPPASSDPLSGVSGTPEPATAPMYSAPPPPDPFPAPAQPPAFPPAAYPAAPPYGSGYPPPVAYPPPGYPAQQYPPPPGYPMFGQAPQAGVNGAAIASLIFGILGGVLISVICGIVALTQIPRRGQRGKGLAIAGLSLSGFWVVAIAAVVVMAAVTEDPVEPTDFTTGSRPTVEATATPTTSPSAPGDGKTATEDLVAGDCISHIDDDSSADEFSVVLCRKAHGGEVYYTWSFPKGTYPGEAKVDAEASKRCDKALDKFAVGKFANAKFWYIYPTPSSWSQDRLVTCIAVPKSGQWTGSMVNK